jgi:hypothetical protein
MRGLVFPEQRVLFQSLKEATSRSYCGQAGEETKIEAKDPDRLYLTKLSKVYRRGGSAASMVGARVSALASACMSALCVPNASIRQSARWRLDI